MAAVGVNDADIGPIGKCCLSVGSEIGIQLDGMDMTGSSGKFRKNCAVIAGAHRYGRYDRRFMSGAVSSRACSEGLPLLTPLSDCRANNTS